MKPMRIVPLLFLVPWCAVACGAPQARKTEPSPAPIEKAAVQDTTQVAQEPGPFAQCESDILACAIFALDFIKDEDDKLEALDHLLRGYARAGMVEEALERAEEIPFEEYRYEAFLSITQVMSRSDDCDKIPEIREKLPLQALKDVVLRHAAECYAYKGNIDRAVEVLEMIKDKDKKDYARASTALGFAEAGKFDAAEEAIKAVTSKDSQEYFSAEIAKVAVKAGAYDRAMALAKNMSKVGKNRTYRDIVKAYVEEGKISEAHQLAESIKDPYFKSLMLVDVALGHVKTGDNQQALKLVDQALKTDGTIKSYGDSMRALSVIAEAYYKVGKYKKSEKLCLAPQGSFGTSSCSINLASWLTSVGEYQMALEILDGAKWSEFKEETLIDLGLAAVETGQAEALLKGTKSIKNPLTLEYLFRGMAEGYIKAGKFDKVTGLADYAKDNEMKCVLNHSFAVKFAEAGEYDRALELAKRVEAFQKKNPESDCNSATSDVVMYYMADNFAKAGEYNKAKKSMADIESKSLQSTALQAIALAYAAKGDGESALTLLLENEKPEALSFALGELFQFYANEKQLDRALLVAVSGPEESQREERIIEFANLFYKPVTMYGWTLEAEDIKVKDKKVGKLIIDILTR